MGECEANNKTLNSRTLLIGETKSIQPQSNRGEGGKPEYPEENRLEQRREPTNSTHL